MLLLSNEDIVPLIGMRDAIGLLDRAFKAYGEGRVLNVPWSVLSVPSRGEGQLYRFFELRSALPLDGVFAIRLISNVAQPSGAGLRHAPELLRKRVDQVMLFDTGTGQLSAMLAGRHMQTLRVGATSAIGTRYLAREDAATLGLLGAGTQAETQLEGTALVRSLERVLVFSRTRESREQFALRMQPRYPFPIEPASSVEDLISRSDILISATNSKDPVFDGSLVRPGTHVNTLSVGQVDDAILRRSSIFATTKEPIMEHLPDGTHEVYERDAAYHTHWDRIRELEPVMLGAKPGRGSIDEITLFYGSGAGLQFAAMGRAVLAKAREQGVGRDLPDDWFLG